MQLADREIVDELQRPESQIEKEKERNNPLLCVDVVYLCPDLMMRGIILTNFFSSKYLQSLVRGCM